jgi:hypothetical protein
MTIKELRNMTRREQIGILADAMENKNKLLSKLVVSVMAESQIDTSSENTKRKPMLTKRQTKETNAQRSERLNFLRRIND